MSLKVISNIRDMQSLSNRYKVEGKKIGFVPTMGYLHEGHLSLVKESKRLTDVTVVSIFVNPAQFAPNEDLKSYPSDFERDKELLEKTGVDILFFPEANEIYPKEYKTYVSVEELTSKLEGSTRPTHFRGVTTIVAMLFNIVKPDVAVFGQKDAHQAAVIKQMVTDLKFDINVVVAPIMRESDGLAMSSRNKYLSKQERQDSLVLYKALQIGKELVLKGERNTNLITSEMKKIIETVDTSVLDYIKIVDYISFDEKDFLDVGNKYYMLIACKIGATRLIDNELISL